MVDKLVANYKKKLITENKKGLVLDIDETLSWTIGYWVEEMQQKFGNPENLSIKDLIEKYHYTQKVPYWQTPEALVWMESKREDNEIQEHLTLIAESNSYVKKINSIIPIIGYLTIRPRSVVTGTKKWLQKNDFPEVDIITRPANVPSQDGDKWKAEVLHFLYPQVEGIIDDKTAVAEYLPKDYQGTFFLYNNEISKLNHLKIFSCNTWQDIYIKVKTVFGTK